MRMKSPNLNPVGNATVYPVRISYPHRAQKLIISKVAVGCKARKMAWRRDFVHDSTGSRWGIRKTKLMQHAQPSNDASNISILEASPEPVFQT